MRPQRQIKGSIAVFEWGCGGGLGKAELMQGSDSLLAEGRAMLKAMIGSLAHAGWQVRTCLNPACFGEEEFRQLVNLCIWKCIENCNSSPDHIIQVWKTQASAADMVLVVAPESEGLLGMVVEGLSTPGKTLLNCSNPLLANASDKQKTARQLLQADLPHPPTLTLRALGEMHHSNSELAETWFAGATATWGAVSAGENEPRWVLKPADGCGCEGIHVLTNEELSHWCSSQVVSSSNLLVQPWLQGTQHYSCSGFAHDSRQVVWFPPVSQKLRIDGRIAYQGGELRPEFLAGSTLSQLLDRAVLALGEGARGWLSFDLSYDPQAGDWWIIECNPRMTTSFVGLSHSYSGNLLDTLVSCQDSRELSSLLAAQSEAWRSVQFDQAGKVHPE